MHTWRGMSAGWFIAFEWLPYYTRLIHYNEPGWIETETMSKPDLRMSSTSKQQATTLTSICNMHEECVEMTEVWHCAPMSSVQSWDESEEWIWSLQIQSSKLDSIGSDLLCRNEIGARWRNRECGARGGRAGQGSPRHALSRHLFSSSGSFDANCGVPVRPLYLITPQHMGWNLRRCRRAFSRIRSFLPSHLSPPSEVFLGLRLGIVVCHSWGRHAIGL